MTAYMFGNYSSIILTANIKEGIGLHFYASMISGFLTAFNSMPFDVTKTRLK